MMTDSSVKFKLSQFVTALLSHVLFMFFWIFGVPFMLCFTNITFIIKPDIVRSNQNFLFSQCFKQNLTRNIVMKWSNMQHETKQLARPNTPVFRVTKTKLCLAVSIGNSELENLFWYRDIKEENISLQ